MAKFYKEIPKLFQLEKYQGLDKFNACEWFYALSGRQMIFNYIKDPMLIDTIGELSDGERKKVLKQAIEKVLKDPLSLNFDFNYIRKNLQNDESVRVFVFGDDEGSEEFMWVDKYHYPPAKQMKNIDLKYLKAATDLNKHHDDMNVVDSLFNNNGIINQYAEVPIVINPFFSDEIIIDKIRELLIKIRQENNIRYSKVISNKMLKAWARYRILAYMDLWLWSRIFLEQNEKFSFATYHKAIFPDNARNQSTIEKEVKPLTDEIFSYTSSDTFHYEEQEKPKSISIMDHLQIFAAVEKARSESRERSYYK
ncbi:hypothetical protein KTI59_15025 [Acinetobacter radioresistens]|uniref:DUF6387 family protein n=1 Tax=Acinetobacter radioresistens TaxID=40216 RepID=UPI0021CD726C|nr:DUF6387 family protein [Acinetobacter radioresistens]MCU4501380.1 hypothetical protein [Acinetobacter radioresistens]